MCPHLRGKGFVMIWCNAWTSDIHVFLGFQLLPTSQFHFFLWFMGIMIQLHHNLHDWIGNSTCEQFLFTVFCLTLWDETVTICRLACLITGWAQSKIFFFFGVCIVNPSNGIITNVSVFNSLWLFFRANSLSRGQWNQPRFPQCDCGVVWKGGN